MAIHNISYPLRFFGFTQSGPKLPQWYTDYYSQEDILQSAAEVIQRLVAWTDIILEDIVTLTDAVNDAIGFDPTLILAELAQLNTDVAALQASGAANTADITALETLTGALNTAIGTLTTRVTTLEGNVSGLTTEVTGLSGQVGTLNTNVSNLTTTVGTLETNVGTLNTNVGTLTTTVGTLETNVNQAVADANAALAEVGTYDGRLTDLESTVGSLETNVNQAVEDANAALAEVATYDGRITSAENAANNATTLVGALDDTVTTQGASVTAVQGNVSTLTTDLGVLQGRVTAVEGEVTMASNEAGQASTKADQAAADVATLSSTVAPLPGRVTTLEGEIVTERGRITTTNGNVSSLTTRVTTAEKSITSVTNNLLTTNGTVTELSESLTETQGDVATNATNIAALQAAAGGNAFHYSKGNGIIAIDVDNNEKVFLPLQIPFAAENATYQYKRTTRTDPVAVPGAIHYITNSDGSDGMLYIYDERGLNLAWGQLDNLTWNFTSAPPSGRFIPLMSGTASNRSLTGVSEAQVAVWVRPEDSLDGTLVNIPINAMIKTYGEGNPSGNQSPSGQYSVMGTWLIPEKITLVRVTQLQVEDPEGPPGSLSDFEVSGCFETFTKVSTYGPPPTVKLVPNAAWTAYSTGKDLTSVSSELMFLVEGLKLP